jgi:hypothetical protein
MTGLRRIALACAVAVCLGGTGCGAGDEERATPAAGVGGEPATPSPAVAPEATVQPLRYGPGARAAIAAGRVAVVDLANRAAVEPATMDVNREQTLASLRWSGWDTPSATGRGEVDTLVCEPTCATGRRERSRATIVLSAPRRCDGRRFYTRSSMTYEERGTGRTRAPDTYLRTPPC